MIINHSKFKQSGSMLLEALVAILIFSIGILALVGMQAAAINNVSDAKYRSTAGFLANEIVGTIWSTRKFPLDPITSQVSANASGVVVSSPNPTFCFPVACGGAIGNAYTIAWASSVIAALPRGTASISMVNYTDPAYATSPAASKVTVTIGWQAPKDAVPHVHAVSTFIN